MKVTTVNNRSFLFFQWSQTLRSRCLQRLWKVFLRGWWSNGSFPPRGRCTTPSHSCFTSDTDRRAPCSGQRLVCKVVDSQSWYAAAFLFYCDSVETLWISEMDGTWINTFTFTLNHILALNQFTSLFGRGSSFPWFWAFVCNPHQSQEQQK